MFDPIVASAGNSRACEVPTEFGKRSLRLVALSFDHGNDRNALSRSARATVHQSAAKPYCGPVDKSKRIGQWHGPRLYEPTMLHRLTNSDATAGRRRVPNGLAGSPTNTLTGCLC